MSQSFPGTEMTRSRPIPISTENIGGSVGLPSPPVAAQEQMSNYNRYLLNHTICPRFADSYLIRHEIGSGGFGFVCSAIRLADNLTVAVKFIIKSKIPKYVWINDPELGCCPLEVASLRSIQHPNIIKFIDYFVDNDICYLVTELFGFTFNEELPQYSNHMKHSTHTRPAMDLFEFIERNNRLSESKTRYVFRQILDAIAHLHSLGLVHRDVKDENILLSADFQVKLIDFGSVSFYNKNQKLHFSRFLGTIQYASPEILLGQSYNGPAAEIWQLGCCLYIMLTGQVPFSSAKNVISSNFAQVKVPLTDTCIGLIHGMLEKDPELRLTLEQVSNHPWLF